MVMKQQSSNFPIDAYVKTMKLKPKKKSIEPNKPPYLVKPPDPPK
jgi:hypothetical protein